METNVIKRIVKSLVLLTLVVFGIDRAIGYFLTNVYEHQRSGLYKQTSYAIEQANEDLIIIGSSRAMHHYVTTILEDSLNQTAYNLGRDGRNMLYYDAIFSQLLTRYNPHTVILDVNPDELHWKAGTQGEDAMVFALLPYSNYPVIRQHIMQVSRLDFYLSKTFSTYKFNSIWAQLLILYATGPGNSTSIDYKGYDPLIKNTNQLSRFLATAPPTLNTPDSGDLRIRMAFNHILQLAREKNVKLYAVISPVFGISTANESTTYIKKRVVEMGFNFIDFSEMKELKDGKFFKDEMHLVDTGARIFSSKLASQIKGKFN